MTSKEFNVGGRWIIASKHIGCMWVEEGSDDVNKLMSRGVAIEGFLDTIEGISPDVTTGGLANLDNRGLRTWERSVQGTALSPHS